MKIFFICVTAYILFLMHYQNPYKSTYNRKDEDIEIVLFVLGMFYAALHMLFVFI